MTRATSITHLHLSPANIVTLTYDDRHRRRMAMVADAVFALLAYQAVTNDDKDQLFKIAEHATAFSGANELRLESEAQGAAFIETIQKVGPNAGIKILTDTWSGTYTYPVALGGAAGSVGIDRSALATAYLHGFVSNLASALVRIVPLGQTDGQRIIT